MWLPDPVSTLLANAPCVGFSGSRAPSLVSLAAVAQVAAVISPGVRIVVGDAAGVDARVRQLMPHARVFFATAYGSGRGAFAARSIACVQAAAGGIWCSFPASPSPAGLRPSSSSAACFAGYGSGTWASLAFALGLGLGAVAFLPSDIVAPAGWPLSFAGGGWFVAQPPAQQLTLF